MRLPGSGGSLKSKAGAVFWVVHVGCTQNKADCRPPKLLTQVWGADSVTLCLRDKLKVGGCCMYRWAFSLTQVSKALTQRAQLWEMLCLERIG